MVASEKRALAARLLSTALLAGAGLMFGATGWSQQGGTAPRADAAPPADSTGNDLTLRTQFLEAVAGAQKANGPAAQQFWQDAVTHFLSLRRASPPVQEDKRLMFLYAKAQYALNDLAGAATTLDTITQKLQPNHVGALYLLAQINAKNRQLDRAKDLLVEAARAGQFVLRDINGDEGKKTFGGLLNDPAFILRVMGASNGYEVTGAENLHNPFASPLRKPGPDGEDVGPVVTTREDDPAVAELEAQIESLFEELIRLFRERQVEEMVGKFTELRQIMDRYEGYGTQEVREKLEKWKQKFDEMGEVLLSIKLQIYISEGNQFLRAMAEAIRRDEYDKSLEQFTRIEDLCEEMRGEEREVFHRNAEALFLRGRALADRARRLKRIAEFTLDVTGVVVAPPEGKEPDSAIINDRIYREGDTLIDEATDEPIEGLRVVEIVRSTVRFRFEDTEFVRELKPQR